MTWFDSFPTAKVGDFTMLVDPRDENIRKHLQDGGVWEPRGTALVEKEFTGGVFVDAGAHWGYYSLLASKKANMVYAFEGSPYNFRYLLLNILINKIDNVVPYPLTLWHETTTLGESFVQGNTGGSSVGKPDGPQIQAVTLDSLDLGPVDFIKVDAEGADGNILKGALKTIATGNPKILVESPPTEFLRGLGYRIKEDVGDGCGPLTYWRRE